MTYIPSARKIWSPYCHNRAAPIQQQHNTAMATPAMIIVVLDFFGASGAGVIGGVSMFPPDNDRVTCYDV
jgi:hypothetical protein